MSLYTFPKHYDVIVCGAGHAGVEAAMAAARMGCQTAILTQNLDTISQMSCNPSIGGLAKGHVVREIDALGGVMGLNTDATGIQFRMLNARKGPSVQAPRAQCDKKAYQFRMKWLIENQPNLDLHQGNAAEILVGSFANVAAICKHVANDPRPVHILCAGTRDEISLDDILPAGAMVEQLQSAGRKLISDDSGRLAHAAYQHAKSTGLREAMRATRGGRPLVTMGLGTDVDFCSTPDTLPIVPRFDASKGEITA